MPPCYSTAPLPHPTHDLHLFHQSGFPFLVTANPFCTPPPLNPHRLTLLQGNKRMILIWCPGLLCLSLRQVEAEGRSRRDAGKLEEAQHTVVIKESYITWTYRNYVSGNQREQEMWKCNGILSSGGISIKRKWLQSLSSLAQTFLCQDQALLQIFQCWVLSLFNTCFDKHKIRNVTKVYVK